MREEIPKKEITTCDCCKEKYTSKADMRLLVRGNALDYHGDPAASIKVNLDLCDKCYTKVAAFIESIRKGE